MYSVTYRVKRNAVVRIVGWTAERHKTARALVSRHLSFPSPWNVSMLSCLHFHTAPVEGAVIDFDLARFDGRRVREGCCRTLFGRTAWLRLELASSINIDFRHKKAEITKQRIAKLSLNFGPVWCQFCSETALKHVDAQTRFAAKLAV